MSVPVRKLLETAERSARVSILAEFQRLQARLKVKFTALLAEIESERVLKGSVSLTFLFERARLAAIIADVLDEIKSITSNLARIVEDAQVAAVDIAAADFERFIQTHARFNQIFSFNPEAVKEIIGFVQSKTPLKSLLDKLPSAVSRAIKNALIDGVATGAGSREIAKEINTAIGTGAASALTIARTETHSAYRAASVNLYRANGIKQFRFLAALDVRTCVICWSYHGKLLPTAQKPFLHVACRCTVTPVLDGDEEFETGEEKFALLQTGFQKQILGDKRFEMFKKRGVKISHFVANRKTEFGLSRAIKNLADL